MKKIGIVAWGTGENSFGVTKPYLNFFSDFGMVEMINPFDDFNIRDLDLLVLPGGPDVNPVRYNTRPSVWTGKPCHFLEYFDTYVLPKYIAKGVPIFGICRGLQTLNVHFNGTLNQHINHEYSTKSRQEEVHSVYKPGLPKNKHSCIQKVNSLHHQSIKKLGQDLTILGVSDDNHVEAIVHDTLPIAAVQWHPEEIYDDFSTKIINELLNINENEQ